MDPTSARVVTSRFVGSSPVWGSVLTGSLSFVPGWSGLLPVGPVTFTSMPGAGPSGQVAGKSLLRKELRVGFWVTRQGRWAGSCSRPARKGPPVPASFKRPKASGRYKN